MTGCDGLIDLARPVGRQRRKGWRWYTVFVYRCGTCGGRAAVRASSFVGRTPVPGAGAIRCGRSSPQLPLPLTTNDAPEGADNALPQAAARDPRRA